MMDADRLREISDRILELLTEEGLDGLEAGGALTTALAQLIDAAPEEIRYEMLETTLAAIRDYVEGALS
jgi:hypothetical protein